MMNLLRKNMKKVMWLIAAMFIGGIFFWYGSGTRTSNVVAEVGKVKIRLPEYQQNLTARIRRERENNEAELNDKQLFEIKRNVLSAMVSLELRYQEAKNLNITVADEEVIGTIQSLPQFQQDEKFNFNLYRQTLKYSLNSTPDEFEEEIKKNIAVRKLENLILSSVRVPESEIALAYKNQNGSMKDFENNKEKVKNQILQKKRTALYGAWMRNLQNKYKITVNPELAGLKT